MGCYFPRLRFGLVFWQHVSGCGARTSQGTLPPFLPYLRHPKGWGSIGLRSSARRGGRASWNHPLQRTTQMLHLRF